MYLKSSTTVKVFATGLKGYKTVQAISEETKDVIVVIGRDLNVKNDFSKEIESLCKENKLEYIQLLVQYKLHTYIRAELI